MARNDDEAAGGGYSTRSQSCQIRPRPTAAAITVWPAAERAKRAKPPVDTPRARRVGAAKAAAAQMRAAYAPLSKPPSRYLSGKQSL